MYSTTQVRHRAKRQESVTSSCGLVKVVKTQVQARQRISIKDFKYIQEVYDNIKQTTCKVSRVILSAWVRPSVLLDEAKIGKQTWGFEQQKYYNKPLALNNANQRSA